MAPPHRRARTRPAFLTLYAHPFELATAVMLGTSAVSSGLDPEALAEVLSSTLVAVWVIANTLGIAAIVVGLFGSADVTGANPRRTSAMRGLEKAGLYLVAAATAVVALALIPALPLAQLWQPFAQLAAITLACLLRAGAIRKAERIELETLERLNSREYLRQLLDDTLARDDITVVRRDEEASDE